MSRSGIDWVYDWGNKSGRPVTKPSTSIRPGNDRSMVYTRPGSHHPQPVTYSHWERENVKNSSDRYSTGYRPVDHGTNQPLGERECRNCTRPVPRPMIDLQSTGRYDYSTGHTQLLGERENEMLSCDRGSTGWRWPVDRSFHISRMSSTGRTYVDIVFAMKKLMFCL